MSSVDAVVERIFDLYQRYGESDYIGEKVTQIQHAVQCAMIAEKEGHTIPTILGAFFHDIGHLAGQDAGLPRMITEGTTLGVGQHDEVGKQFLLNQAIPEEVADFAKGHVDAKRYLTFKDPVYYQNLSAASKMTLVHQGGKMNQNEADVFEANPRFHEILRMRHWDEMAKDPNMEIKPLKYYKDMLSKYLESVWQV